MALSDLEEMLGISAKPGDEKDEQDDQAGAEEGSETEAASEEEEAPEDDAAPVREREPDSDQGLEQRADDGDPADAEREDSGEDDEEGADPDDLKKQNIGLRKEIAKLREQAKLRQYAPQQQPVAPMAQQSTQQQQRPSPVPVVVSDDGKQVYVDPVALDRLIEQRAAEVAVRATAPSPEQIINYEVKSATEQFLAEDPAHIEVVRRVKEVDEFLTYHVAQLAQEGYRITNTADAVAILESKGVDQQVLNAYPELREIGFADFFDQMSTGKASARRLLLRQIASASKVRTRAPKRPSNGAKRPLGDQPKAMSRKGGGKQTAATSDEREFQTLESEFRESGLSLKDFPESKYKRMNQLGKKLGLEGFV